MQIDDADELDLNKLEDIYHEIKKDLLKAKQIHQQRNQASKSKRGFGSKEPDELDFEELLDTEKGQTSDEEEPEVHDKLQEDEEIKI